MKPNRAKGGFTLVEMLVTITLVSLFGISALLAIAAAKRETEANILESRALVVSDTINIALRDIFQNATDWREQGGELRIVCEKYSGLEMTVGLSDGKFVATFYDYDYGFTSGAGYSDDVSRVELILNSASYAEFAAEDFTLKFENGAFSGEYSLVCGDYSKRVSFVVAPINERPAYAEYE